ncbi:phospholipase D-like domain-containing protein [Nitrococcus mobilis]|uniref:Cardiolipin synthetase n=1 Tax=Nitrococcus mobilis Nb-231 TaxID=314278 RepID=A4BUK1_9GAMM|nr:phospholipase D-like domain-containing protein [Nitrococcus mobilis]EAR20567.1 cardiolipin synthetase [Nitrococcus mobilis Nb-231]
MLEIIAAGKQAMEKSIRRTMGRGAASRALTGMRDCVTAVFPKRVYIEGDELYHAMLSAIRSARRSISLETYIYADDAVGRRFSRALAERAESGVKVRLLVDAFGSLGCFPRRTEKELRVAGVQVRRFHRWQWRHPLRYNRRNHRKLLVIDRHYAFLGGFNIHEQSSRVHTGSERWRDTHVHFEGALAREAEALFDLFWYQRWRYHHALRLPATDVLASNHNSYTRQRLRYFVDDILESARLRLWVSTPYFVPDQHMQRRLIRAAQRGVDVRMLVPHKSDVQLTRWASCAVYAKLLDEGVRIFEYLPRMLHAKIVLADGEWCMVGTSNLDYRSSRHNYELNLISADPALCRELEEHFRRDLQGSAEVHHRGWAARPLFQRLVETIGWLIRGWL